MEEIIARTFIAADDDVPVIKIDEDVQTKIAEDYCSKLRVEDIILPDLYLFKSLEHNKKWIQIRLMPFIRCIRISISGICG